MTTHSLEDEISLEFFTVTTQTIDLCATVYTNGSDMLEEISNKPHMENHVKEIFATKSLLKNPEAVFLLPEIDATSLVTISLKHVEKVGVVFRDIKDPELCTIYFTNEFNLFVDKLPPDIKKIRTFINNKDAKVVHFPFGNIPPNSVMPGEMCYFPVVMNECSALGNRNVDVVFRNGIVRELHGDKFLIETAQRMNGAPESFRTFIYKTTNVVIPSSMMAAYI